MVFPNIWRPTAFRNLLVKMAPLPFFSATLIRAILKNPVYCGKIAFGRRKLEKIHGTRNEYHQVPQENYLLVDGLHKGIVSEELWNAAQVKLLAQSKRYEPVNRSKTEQAHLLSALVKCPVCGAGMYSNKCTKRKKDGTPYKSFSYYSCKHRKDATWAKMRFQQANSGRSSGQRRGGGYHQTSQQPKFATMMQRRSIAKWTPLPLNRKLLPLKSSCGSIIPSSPKLWRRSTLLTRMTAITSSANPTLTSGFTGCTIKSRKPKTT